MSFRSYQGSVRRNVDIWRNGMWRDIEIGVVIHRRIRLCYLCFAHPPAFAVSLVLEQTP